VDGRRRKVRQRGVVALFVLAGLAVLLTSGVALAADSINCSGGFCVGTAKDDTMHGTAGPDEMVAGRGDDWESGMGSGDSLHGQEGKDSLKGGHGADQLYGSFGDDKLVGATGDDLLRGDDDFDYNRPGGGRDRLYGGSGDDELYGYYGDDKLVGGEGNDIINAYDVRHPMAGVEDVIDCGPGRDTVYFDKGFDKVLSNCEVKKPTSD
jgi:Ca2+-binding RTX toxin-like protein